jgi:two-component system sensor histidine kinase ChvG
MASGIATRKREQTADDATYVSGAAESSGIKAGTQAASRKDARASAKAEKLRAPRPVRRFSLLFSPIARLILASNLAGLLILITGAVILNELRSGLVEARKDSLLEQAVLIGSHITDVATVGEPEPLMDSYEVRRWLKRVPASENTRIRIFDSSGTVIADSYLLNDEVERSELPPIRQPSSLAQTWLKITRAANNFLEGFDLRSKAKTKLLEVKTLDQEKNTALSGDRVSAERFGDRGERVISVSVPIRRVGAVLGALTMETSDIAQVIAAERAALLPFIFVALLTALITSLLLTATVARPLTKLARASDQVRTGAAQRLDLGRIHDRKDEMGDLARALEAMTATLYDRIQANERFAADVAHELKNPLTSIRSAVETSNAVEDPAVRERLRGVIHRDVLRLDRLISDISNLSRLEAEIVREQLVRVDFVRLVQDLGSIYQDTQRDRDPKVTLAIEGTPERLAVLGREGPLGQVFRNLVENARSFSPPGGEVTVTLTRVSDRLKPIIRLTVEDQGPGIPPDKLEKIFERFYSDRPKGSKFGNNSGLGLSIVRQIVETHGGRVWAENRDSQGQVIGARFTVDLPPAASGP